MAQKDSFILYADLLCHLQHLTDEQAGKLFKGILVYASTNELPTLDGAEMMAFSFIKAQMDRDSEKYDKVCERNRANGSKGGRPKKTIQTDINPSEPQKPSGFSGNPKKHEHDPEHDTDPDIPPISPKGVDERFSQFWKVYPKKIGKGAAEKAFHKIKPDPTLLAEIIEAVGRAKESDQWKRDGGQYIPNPATWLNQRRWEDELSIDVQNGGERWKMLE